MLRDLFDWLVQPCLNFIRLHCKMLVQASPNHLIVMMLRLFHCLLDEIIHSGEQGYETLSSPQVCCVYFVFIRTRSVAAGFGRHGMPPPASMTQLQHWAKTGQTHHMTLRL